jgi:DNA-binding IclR family transcriptional regulator
VATPVLDAAGQALAAISVTGPAPRIDPTRLAGLLREHAQQVSAAL